MLPFRTVLVSVAASGLLLVSAQARADGTVVQKQKGTTAAPWGYLEYVPPGYTGSAALHPIVVALSGLGELGNGTTQLNSVATAGPIRLINDGSKYFEQKSVIVIQPQAPDQWQFGPQQKDMKAFFTYLLATYKADPKRVYLTGLSAGGGGVYAFAGSPDGKAILAGILSICGNSEAYDSLIPSMKDIPMWSFHNWDDPTNPRKRAIDFTTKVGRLRSGNAALDVMSNYPNVGGNVNNAAASTLTATYANNGFTWQNGQDATGPSTLRLTMNPTGGHNAWTKAYGDTNVWDWLLSQGEPTVTPSGDAGTSTDGGASGGLSDGGTGGAPDGGASSGSNGGRGASSGATGNNDSDAPGSDGGCSAVGFGTRTMPTLAPLAICLGLLRLRKRNAASRS